MLLEHFHTKKKKYNLDILYFLYCILPRSHPIVGSDVCNPLDIQIEDGVIKWIRNVLTVKISK